jgi:hypothetical protein
VGLSDIVVKNASSAKDFPVLHNACVVQPPSRRVRQESANTTTETITAGNYVEITARGGGLYQRFVSTFGP